MSDKLDVTPAVETSDEDAERPVSIFDVCETDADAEENGRWFDGIWEAIPEAAVKLRRLSAHKCINCRQQLMAKYRRYMSKGKYPPDIDQKMLIELMAQSVVLDWKGIYDKDGKPIHYSKDAAERLLKMLDFRAPLLDLATRMDSFRSEELEEAAGN